MFLRRVGAVVLGSLVVCCSCSLAAPDALPPLTLAEAQRLAATRNADLAVARAQVASAAAGLRSAKEFPNPTLSLSTSSINTDGRTNATAAGNGLLDRSYDSIVALGQLFEIGKRGPRQESARAGQRAAEAQRDDVRRLLIKAVDQAYVAAVEANEESRVLENSAASLRREAQLAAMRFSAGDIAASDQAQIEIGATQRELDAAAAHNTATAAIIALETLLGEPAPRGTTPLADSLASLATLPAGLEDQTLVGTRPDIAAAEASVAKAEADLTGQRRIAVPDVTVSAQYERNPPDFPNSAGVGLSLPLPLWNRNGGGINAARAARDQAQAQLDKVRIQVAADISAAQSAYREARARADAYGRELTAKSAGVVKTVGYAYEHGGAALVELLAAERNDNDIRIAAARAQADAASAASALSAACNRNDPGPLAAVAP